MAANKISQIEFFSVILKIGFNEFNPWVEIAEINGLQAKMATCQLKIKWAWVPTIYARWKPPDSHVSRCVVCGFYHFCKQMRFLSLTEMDAVFSVNNIISHLSSAYAPGIVLSTSPASSHLFPPLGFVYWYFLSSLLQHYLLVYKNIITAPWWFQPLWNCI